MTRDALMPAYARLPVTLVRGEGCRVWADDGTPYLDLLGGLGALSLGHAHPRWVRAVCDAAATLGLTTNLVTTAPQAALAARLAAITPVDEATVFFCNSGAEANEALLKLVRKHGLATGRPVVLALEGSFHGRTIAALAATDQPPDLPSAALSVLHIAREQQPDCRREYSCPSIGDEHLRDRHRGSESSCNKRSTVRTRPRDDDGRQAP